MIFIFSDKSNNQNRVVYSDGTWHQGGYSGKVPSKPLSKEETEIAADIVETVSLPVGLGLKTWYAIDLYMKKGEQAAYDYLKGELIGHAAAFALMKFIKHMAKLKKAKKGGKAAKNF